MNRCETCKHGTAVDGLYYRCALQAAWTYRTRCDVGKWEAKT